MKWILFYFNLFICLSIYLKPQWILKIAAPIPRMLKYSVVHSFLNSLPIFINVASKFIVCKYLYIKTLYSL